MSDNNQTILTLNRITIELNRSVPIPLLILGTIGNVLNIYILTRKTLQKNSCAFYFLSLTIANLISLWFGLFTRLLSGYDLDPTVWNSIACKFRFYIAYVSLTCSAFFLVYASIDRWASSNSNVNRRLFSRIHIAQRLVICTSLFFCLFYLETFYCYSTVENQFPINCYSPNQICRIYNDVLYLVLFALVPSIFMLAFGYRTVQQVKKIHQQVHTLTLQNHFLRRKDRQMMIMLLVQVIFFFICVTPSGISKLYTTLMFSKSNDVLTSTKNNFFFQISVLIVYINCCSAFYIYTLTGKIFRREIKRLIPIITQTNTTLTNGIQNQIAPAYF